MGGVGEGDGRRDGTVKRRVYAREGAAGSIDRTVRRWEVSTQTRTVRALV